MSLTKPFNNYIPVGDCGIQVYILTELTVPL